MDTLFFLLLGIGLLVALITGIVYLASSLFRFLLGDSKPLASPSSCCPRCATPLKPGAKYCGICHWPEVLARGDRSYLIRAQLEQQLLHYQRLNLLKAEDVQAWILSLQAEPQPIPPPPLAELMPFDSIEERRPSAEPVSPAPATPIAHESLDAHWSVEKPLAFDEPTPPPLLPARDVDDPFRLVIPGQSGAQKPSPLAGKSAYEIADKERRLAALHAAVKTIQPEQPAIANPARDPLWLAPAAAQAIDGTAPHALDEVIPAPSVRPPVGRTPLTTILGAFLEENNIRWGELIGGLLIICCSIALVISFWAQINERPLFKFSLFNGVTAAIYGMGFYTERRWKIRTTSLGLLLIGVLLTPLNFLAIAAYTDLAPPTDLLGLAGEGVSLLVFTGLLFFAARELTPGFAITTTIGVMLPCLWQLLTRRFIAADSSPLMVYFFTAVPLASYLLGTAIPLDRLRRAGRWNEQRANRIFTLLFILTASTLMPWALLLYKSGDLLLTLTRLSPLLVLAGLPALAVGLLSAKKITAPPLVKLRLVGMSLGVLGAAIITASMVLAWPAVELLVPVLLGNIIVFSLAAWRLKIPAAYLPSGMATLALTLLMVPVLRGELLWSDNDSQRLLALLLSATSGINLASAALGFLAVAALWTRNAHAEEAHWFTRLGQAAALAGLVLVTVFGFGRTGDPEDAAWIYSAYTLALLVAAGLSGKPVYCRLASGLLLLTLVQGIVYRLAETAIPAPWLIALLIHSSLVGAAANVSRFLRLSGLDSWRALLVNSCLLTTGLALLGMAYWVTELEWMTSALLVGWIALIGLLLSLTQPSPPLLVAFQGASSLAIMLGVIAGLSQTDWYLAAKHPWLDSRFLGAQALAIAGMSLAWTLFTAFIERRKKQAGNEAPHELLTAWNQAQPGVFAQACSLLASLALFGLSLVAVTPGIAQELSPVVSAAPFDRATLVAPLASHFEVFGIAHEHAAGIQTVILLGLVMLTLAIRWWHRREDVQLFGLLMCLGCGVLLLATRWESDTAVASALRWLMSGLILVGSLGLWQLDSLTHWLSRVGIMPEPVGLRAQPVAGQPAPQPTALLIRRTLLGMGVVTYLGLAFAVTVLALHLPRTAGFAVPLSILSGISAAGILGGMLLHRQVFADDAPAQLGPQGSQRFTVTMTLGLSGIGLLALLIWGGFATLSLAQTPVLGPTVNAWFFTIGNPASYGWPLLTVALAMFSFGLRERSETLLFVAQLLLNVTFSLVYLFFRLEQYGKLDATALIELAMGNASLSALLTLAWFGFKKWQTVPVLGSEPPATAKTSPLLLAQVSFATFLLWLPLVPAILRIIADPSGPFWSAAAGSLWAWVAAATVFAAHALTLPRTTVRSPEFLGTVVSTLAALLPLSLIPWDRGDWLVYHALALGIAVAGIAILAAATWNLGRGTEGGLPWRRWAGVLILVTFGLGLRSLMGDPAAPWWTVGLWLVAAGQLAWAAGLAARREPLWLLPWLVNAAASLAWYEHAPLRLPESLLQLLWVNVLAGVFSLAVSLGLEWWCFSRRAERDARRFLPLHQVLAWLGIATLATTTYFSINADLARMPLAVEPWLPVVALLALLCGTFACLWDAATRHTVAMLYCLGLVATGMFVDVLDTHGPLFVFTVILALAAYSVATSYLWSIRAGLRSLAAIWKIPVDEYSELTPGDYPAQGQVWLISANGLLSLVVLALVFWGAFYFEEPAWRLTIANAILAQTVSLGLLARGTVRSVLQYTTLGMGVLFVLAVGFALLPLNIAAPLLHRLVTAAVAISLTVPLYGLGIVKLLRRENEWTHAATRILPLLLGLAALLFLVVLGIETTQFLADAQAHLLWPAILAVALALGLLTVAALAAAILPGRDPLQLSHRGKTGYVYAAEGLLGLLFLHIRVSLPWLFSGWFAQFWPLIVMGIAFVGVGFSEYCCRRAWLVLAEPLERTGALLPLLPVLGIWMFPSQVHGSLVLLVVGALYLALSIMRHSLLFSGLALLAVNGSLWFYLQSWPGLEISRHPQLWIIPPTLCVLIAAHLNRGRLSEEQQTSVRYIASIVLYASSCADVFINGVAIAPWLPLVLAALSILGVFAGILLRVRAFLYLGTVFLLVALFTMIWYAAVELDRTWIWWVCGIVTGILIIALFGLFEKKRDDMLRLVEQLKQWEA